MTVLCNTALLTSGGNNSYICNNIAGIAINSTTQLTYVPAGLPSGGGTASGNIDPLCAPAPALPDARPHGAALRHRTGSVPARSCTILYK